MEEGQNFNLFEVVICNYGSEKHFEDNIIKCHSMEEEGITKAIEYLKSIKVSQEHYQMFRLLDTLSLKLFMKDKNRNLDSFYHLLNAFIFTEINDNNLSSKLFPDTVRGFGNNYIKDITTLGRHNFKKDLDFVSDEITKLSNNEPNNLLYNDAKIAISKFSQYLISKNLLNKKELEKPFLGDESISNMEQSQQFQQLQEFQQLQQHKPQSQFRQELQFPLQPQFKTQQDEYKLFKQRITDFANLDKEIPVAEVFDDIGINLENKEKETIRDCTIKKRDLIDRVITCDVNQIIYNRKAESKPYINNTRNLLKEICKPTNMNSNNSQSQEVYNLIDKKVDEEYEKGDKELAELRHNLKYYIADFKIPVKYIYETNDKLKEKYNEKYDDLYSHCNDFRKYLENNYLPYQTSLSYMDENKKDTIIKVDKELGDFAEKNSNLFKEGKYKEVQPIPYEEINNEIPIITILEEIGLGEKELFEKELKGDKKKIFDSLFINRQVLTEKLFNATPLTFLLSLSANIESYEKYDYIQDNPKINPIFDKMIANIAGKLANRIDDEKFMNNVDAFIARNKIGFGREDMNDELNKNQRRSASNENFSHETLAKAKTMNKVSFAVEQANKRKQQNSGMGIGGK